IVALVVAAVALFGGDNSRDPDQALARAQEAVREATTLRFNYHATIEAPDLSDEDALPVDGVGEWTPDAWRIAETFGEDTYELRRIADVLYERSVWDGDPIEDERWLSYDYEDLTKQDLVEYLEFMGEILGDDTFFDEDESAVFDAESYGVIVALMVFLHNSDS